METRNDLMAIFDDTEFDDGRCSLCEQPMIESNEYFSDKNDPLEGDLIYEANPVVRYGDTKTCINCAYKLVFNR